MIQNSLIVSGICYSNKKTSDIILSESEVCIIIFSILDTVIPTYSKNLELVPNICWEFSSPGESCFGYFSGQGLPQGSLRHMPIK